MFLVKVSVDQDQWSHQSPHIKANADPAGGDLHPHRWPPAGHGLIIGVRAADTEKHATNRLECCHFIWKMELTHSVAT